MPTDVDKDYLTNPDEVVFYTVVKVRNVCCPPFLT